MKFSVLVPVYNVESLLPICIESILNQTYHDLELILVVDGSPDRSEEVCKEYSQKDSRIQVVVKENGGPMSARKEAILHATGDYIIFVDGDDYIHRELLSNLVGVISEHPDTDMIGFGYYEDRDGKISDPIQHGLPEGYYSNPNTLKNCYLFDYNNHNDNNGCLNFALWTKCFRRTLYEECQSKVPNTVKNSEDTLCTAWYISKLKHFSIIKFAGYYYRNNESSLTHIRKPYDLVNLTNVKNYLENIGAFSHGNIGHWYLMSHYVLLRDMARSSENIADYQLFLQSLNYDPKYDKLRFYKSYSIKERMKYKLVQQHKWYLLYWCVKLLHL